MASNPLPPPPPGFKLDTEIPPPPPGFMLEGEQKPAGIPGMEKLGGTPPGPAAPPIPYGLTGSFQRTISPIEMSMGGMAGSGGAPAGTPGPTAEGITQMLSGAGAVIRNLSPNAAALSPSAGVGQPLPQQDPRKAAQGAADVITGGFQVAAPLAGPALVAAPAATLAAIGLGSLADVATSKGMKALGVPGEYANLGGAVAALLAGGKWGHEALTKVHESLGSPEIKIGGKFEEPKPFPEMSDAELIAHANKIEAEPPKNYNWQKEQIVQEAAKRQAERGIPTADDVPPPPTGFVREESPIEGGSLYKYTKRVRKPKPAPEAQPPAVAPAPQEEATAAPPPGNGMTRMYHGGVPDPIDGPRWFSSDLRYAQGYASKTPGAIVHYVDIPTDHPLIEPQWADQSIAAGFHQNVQLPEDLSVQARPYVEAPAPTVAEPPDGGAASNKEVSISPSPESAVAVQNEAPPLQPTAASEAYRAEVTRGGEGESKQNTVAPVNPPAIPEEARGTGQEQNTEVVAPEQKQPWEMTRGEYVPQYTPTEGPDIAYRDASGEVKPLTYREALDQKLIDKKRYDHRFGGLNEKQARTMYGVAAHRNAVYRALQEGQPVPLEVLADYPELTQKAEAKPPDGGAQPTPKETAPVNPIKLAAAKNTLKRAERKAKFTKGIQPESKYTPAEEEPNGPLQSRSMPKQGGAGENLPTNKPQEPAGEPQDGAVRYVRFGEPPVSGRSRNFMDGHTEAGVSAYKMVRRDGEWLIDGAYGSYRQLLGSGKPLYEITGNVLPQKGADGEPLLSGVQVRGRIKAEPFRDTWRVALSPSPTEKIYQNAVTGEIWAVLNGVEFRSRPEDFAGDLKALAKGRADTLLRQLSGKIAPAPSEAPAQQSPAAPLQARLEGPSFRLGMSQSQKLSEAQALPARAGREKYPILRVNAQAMDLLHAAGGLDSGHDIPGVTFTVPQAEEVLRNVNVELQKARVRGQKEQVRKWTELREAIEENRGAAKGRPMVVVQHGPDVTPEEHTRALAEELDHAAQLEATGDIYAHHLGPEGTRAFLDSPEGSKAAAQIRKTYDVGDSQVVMEIGVRLMRPGRYRELGLTADEAAELQRRYIDTLIQRHGVGRTLKITDKVSAAREKDKEVSYGHQTPLEARRGVGREGVRETTPSTRSGSKGSGQGDGGLPSVREEPLQSKREGPRFKKQESRLKQVLDVPKSVRERIKQEGPAGVELMRKIDRADTIGTVMAGKRVDDLNESGITKLTREQRFGSRGSLLDMLEGREPISGDVGKIASVIRGLFDQTAGEATAAGVKSRRQATIRPEDPIPAGAKLTRYQQERRDEGKRVFVSYRKPFQKRTGGYAPHVIPPSDVLRKGPIRVDILDNMVHIGAAPDAAHAEAMLDEYRKFEAEGGRAKLSEKHLIDSGQARDESEARALMARIRKKGMRRQGSLEYSRVADLPFYDPDMLRVLPKWLASVSMRLAEVREFKQNGEEINKLIHRIEAANGNAGFVRAAVDRGLKMIRDGDTGDEQAARFFTTLNAFRLSLSFIQNVTQGPLNTLLHTHDPILTARATAGAFTKEGRRFAARSGTSLEGMLNEMVRSVGRDDSALGKAVEKYLGVAFTPSEKQNRVTAAIAGKLWAEKMLRRLKLNPKDELARDELAAMGLKPDVLLKIGKVDGDAALVAGKAFSDATQFRSRVWDMTNFSTKSGVGKMVWQFKNYGYQQFRLAYRDSIGEIRKGRWGRGAATILILATLFPMTGEVIADIRSLISGRKRPAKALDRYIEDIAQGSALGIVADTIQGGMARRGAETIGGPPVSIGGQALDTLASFRGDKDVSEKIKGFGKGISKLVLGFFGGAGTAVSNRIFPPREAQSPDSKKLNRKLRKLK